MNIIVVVRKHVLWGYALNRISNMLHGCTVKQSSGIIEYGLIRIRVIHTDYVEKLMGLDRRAECAVHRSPEFDRRTMEYISERWPSAHYSDDLEDLCVSVIKIVYKLTSV